MAPLARNYTIILGALFAGILLFAFFNPAVSNKISEHLPTKKPAPQGGDPKDVADKQAPPLGVEPSPVPSLVPAPPTAAQGEPTCDKKGYGYINGRFNGTWDSKRDAQNRMLTAEQCDVAFPDLFIHLDEMVENVKKTPPGKITRDYMKQIDSSSGDIGGCEYLPVATMVSLVANCAV